jgi:hypothetical protein
MIVNADRIVAVEVEYEDGHAMLHLDSGHSLMVLIRDSKTRDEVMVWLAGLMDPFTATMNVVCGSDESTDNPYARLQLITQITAVAADLRAAIRRSIEAEPERTAPSS